MKFDLADVDHRSIATTNMRWGEAQAPMCPTCLAAFACGWGITELRQELRGITVKELR